MNTALAILVTLVALDALLLAVLVWRWAQWAAQDRREKKAMAAVIYKGPAQ